MSFYQTSNASIVRFRTVPRKTVAPFQTLARVAQIQNIGGGTGAHFTGSNPWQTSAVSTFNNSFLLTPEQITNGALIIAPTSTSNRYYTLPSPFSLQEYLGGRFAFNMAANQVNVGAGANQLNGNNDFFLLNVYNIQTFLGTFYSYDGLQSKDIAVAPAVNDAKLTPVLIRFSGVNSPYATVNGQQNTVTYTIF